VFERLLASGLSALTNTPSGERARQPDDDPNDEASSPDRQPTASLPYIASTANSTPKANRPVVMTGRLASVGCPWLRELGWGAYRRPLFRSSKATSATMGSTMIAAVSHPGAPRFSAMVAISAAMTISGMHQSRAMSDWRSDGLGRSDTKPRYSPTRRARLCGWSTGGG
jgi:hypothetical protein